jgi:hypothetical protein
MSVHFVGSNKRFEILENLGGDSLLPVIPAMQARAGVGAQAIAITIYPGRSRQHRRRPPLPAMVLRKSSASPASLPLPPPTALPISVAQFARTLLPSKTDMPRSTPQAISTAGKPVVKIVGPEAPWPSSALLQPATIAVIVVLVTGVCGQCHHPGEPVQAGGVVDQVDLPAPARCIKALLAMVPPLLLPPSVSKEEDTRFTNANNSPTALAQASAGG